MPYAVLISALKLGSYLLFLVLISNYEIQEATRQRSLQSARFREGYYRLRCSYRPSNFYQLP